MDFNKNNDLPNFIGALRIQAQRTWEGAFGYPMKRHNQGQENYRHAIKKLKELYKDNNPSKALWYESQKLHFHDLL